MKKFNFLMPACALLLIVALLAGCGKKTATSKAPDAPPQKVFVDGAKTLLSTDFNNLLTEKEDGTSVLGLTSDFYNDLDNTSNQTAINLSIGNLSANGETLSESANLALDIAHNQDSGDSSLELSGGVGTDINVSGGIYVKNGVALLKTTSADKKIVQYQLPSTTDKSLTGVLSTLASGILSDAGEAASTQSAQEDRADFAARLLDPWMTETTAQDYTDGTQTKNLLGSDVTLRAITLNMSGQRAYDFVLKNVQLLDTDETFADTSGTLGMLTSLTSTDLQNIISNGSTASATSMTTELLDELKALTPDEIAASSFKMTVLFDGDKAIGMTIDTSTTAKSYKVNYISYQKGLEHQVNMSMQDISGATMTMDLTKLKAGGDSYNVSMTSTSLDETGAQTMSSTYTGTTTENASTQDFTGKFSLNAAMKDDSGTPQNIVASGDISYKLTKTGNTGYTCTGSLGLSLSAAGDTISMTLGIDADMKKSNDVTITPPMFLESNIAPVTDLQSLCDALGLDYSSYSGKSDSLKVAMLIGLLLAQ
ncbi:hypothetical protein IZU99_09470 [Oscillospiraceae bacterium CM]|nr:hypothetical protein IZU99_09470 [Oscillospiraceae bacterium CM]